MNASEPSPPSIWRPILAAIAMLIGISSAVLWTWHKLDIHEKQESQKRFELDAQSIEQRITARLRSYEMVVRGVSSAFVSNPNSVSTAQWGRVCRLLNIWEIYPGISSIAWSRDIPASAVSSFLARVKTDGKDDYRIFPSGDRSRYLPIEFICPINARTSPVVGLDLLTQDPQNEAIRRAIDSGTAQLSQPLSDLYRVSPEPSNRMGLLMYFPVYKSGQAPTTLEERRKSLVGITNAAFRGYQLAESIFGAHLQLFHITLRDVETNATLFDSYETQKATHSRHWQPIFTQQIELSLYGRTWWLEVQGTPAYERGVLSRSQDLVLLMGGSTSFLVALLAGAFVWQRDRQIYASKRTASKLREQAEQLVLSNRYKSDFLANMSHELRTPLNSILILSDQLRQNSGGNLNEKQTRHADIVYRAGSDLLQLINDVLDIAKVEAGRIQLSMEPLNLQDLLVDLDASMRPLAEAKNLHLHIAQTNAQKDLPQRVFTDRVRLHQILRNLLSNAIKFTDEGQINLAVSRGETCADGSVIIRFSVRDTGIGIAPEQHKQAFEAFQQLDGSTRRRHGGTGLGLAITRQLSKALGGDVELQSALGQGSTFTVSLPMQVVKALPASKVPPPKRSGEGQPLLVVEDDTRFASVICEQAHTHGFATVHCITGGQALELLNNETFTAIVLDILLPDISGWQLFRRLRALPEYRHTPVHIISCLPQPEHLDEQDTHYLTKPIARQQLEQLFAGVKDSAGKNEAQTLLLVEDVEAECEHYRQKLSELGFNVSTASDAQSAKVVWAETSFAVLVLDLNLPDEDGFTLLGNLNAIRSLKGVRVVINTGLDVNQQGLQCLQSYSAAVVRKKGDDTDQLGQAVQGFLQAIERTPASEVSVQNSNAADAVFSSAMQPASAELQGHRLLLVDDDIRNVYAMSALLDDFGLDVSSASNGEEAIASYLRSPPDLILMDMSMPVMDGYTATNLLKTEHGCSIPIIALTAHAMKGDREKCLAAGADDYLAKPVERAALRRMLVQWLKPQKKEA